MPLLSRADLFRAGTFFIGVWLLSIAVPGLAFLVFAATRSGIPAYDDGLGNSRLAELVVQLAMGIGLLRGEWLVRLALRDFSPERDSDSDPEGGATTATEGADSERDQ